MRALPVQIQKQINEADALLAAVNAPSQPAPPPAEPSALASPEPAAVPADPAPAPVAVPTPPPEDDAKKWEARYKTLQGMHNQNIGEMKQRLRAVEEQNQTLATQLAQKATTPEPTKPNTQDTDVFGADLVDMVHRVAEQIFGATSKALDSRIAAIEQSLKGTTQAVAQTAEEMFLTRLKEAVPDYAEVNQSDGFLSWLAEVDDVYGVERQQALTTAATALDAARVAKVFNAYKATLAPAAKPAPDRPARNELESQIAPSTAASVQPVQRAASQIAVKDVQAFYREVQAGKYRGREQEAAQLEAIINTALAEGRIIG